MLSAIRSTSEKGTSFGALCVAEIELAKLVFTVPFTVRVLFDEY